MYFMKKIGFLLVIVYTVHYCTCTSIVSIPPQILIDKITTEKTDFPELLKSKKNVFV